MGLLDKFKKDPRVSVVPVRPASGIEKLLRPKPDMSDELPRQRPKGQKVKPQELRQLRELLRQRYDLDLEIWNRRKVGVYNRPIVEESMRKADALLLRIRALVVTMDRREYFNSDAEYMRFKEVKARIGENGKRSWIQNPPWDEE
jgi:hypothetical protein